jgi:hypothetical protein
VEQLIDERNAFLQREQALLSEIELLKKQIANVSSPNRSNNIRVLQQIILGTVDSYLENPSFSLTHEKNKFRQQIAKDLTEMINLFKY